MKGQSKVWHPLELVTIYARTASISHCSCADKIGAWCLMDSIVRFDQSKVYQKEFMKHVPKLLSKYAPEGTGTRRAAQFATPMGC